MPENKTSLGYKWVRKTKMETGSIRELESKGMVVELDSNNDICRYKSRITLKGFKQKQGVDYNETFAPVAKLTSLRLFLALCNKFDIDINQMDVTSAFLYADLFLTTMTLTMT